MELSSDPLLYRPLKVVGMVADSVPFVVNRLGDHTFITVVVGDSFQVYNLDKLAACMVSRAAPGKISHVDAIQHQTFAAVGDTIYCYHRAKISSSLTYHKAPVAGMLSIGKILVSYDKSNHVVVYDSKAKEVVSEFHILRQSPITCAFHPATYLNKLVFGFEDGGMELWNIRSLKLLYSYKALKAEAGALLSIAQSPAVDVLAVGFASGDVMVVNAKLDILLFHFKQKGAVTSLSFRSDGPGSSSGGAAPYLASSSETGGVSFWSLTVDGSVRGKLLHTMALHRRSVLKVAFAQGEPLLISAGEDNSLKVWVFGESGSDALTTTPCRLLRERQGFVSTPQKLLSYRGSVTGVSDYDAWEEIAACEAHGALRSARVGAAHLLHEFSQSALSFSLPPCTAMSASSAEHKWGTLVTAHRQCSTAYTWSLPNHAITSVALRRSDADAKHDRSPHGVARAASTVCVTHCGHFAVVGYADGALLKFNLQSGLPRGAFPPAGEAHVHTAAVTGVAVDQRNLCMATCGADGRVVFWNFHAHRVVAQHAFLHACTALTTVPDAGLVAVGDAQGVVRVFDLTTSRLCRVLVPPPAASLGLAGAGLAVKDLVVSADGRRLIAATASALLLVYDLLASRLINCVLLPAPATGLALARNGDLLLAGEGRFVRVLYDASLSQAVPLWRTPTHPTPLFPAASPAAPPAAPSAEGEEGGDEDEGHEAVARDLAVRHLARMSREPSVSMSTLPRLFSQLLLARSKSRGADELRRPVERAAVPFYLQARGDLRGQIVFDATAAAAATAPGGAATVPVAPGGSRLLGGKARRGGPTASGGRLALHTHNDQLAQLLRAFQASREDDSLSQVCALLAASSPQQCEAFIRDLVRHSEDLEGLQLLRGYLQVLEQLVARGKMFELVQAWVNFTLLTHGVTLIQCYGLKGELCALTKALNGRGEELRSLLGAAQCFVRALLGAPLL